MLMPQVDGISLHATDPSLSRHHEQDEVASGSCGNLGVSSLRSFVSEAKALVIPNRPKRATCILPTMPMELNLKRY